METRGMNARIRSLREQSVTTQAHIDMERAKYFTEIYRQYEGTVSVPELRALALKNYFSKKTLYIGDGELMLVKKAVTLRLHRHSLIFAAILYRI